MRRSPGERDAKRATLKSEWSGKHASGPKRSGGRREPHECSNHHRDGCRCPRRSELHDVTGFDLMLDTLNLAVPLRIMEVKTMSPCMREALARWAGTQFTHADLMLYDPQRKPGQFKHLVDMLAVLAVTADGGVEFAGTRWVA